ncbi:hypothetical protein PCANC_01046 [Puccinia coronata f. sp. avenae]|uniref:Uncharacterized protein n=1 Tax=Puccinia coronata f. sp. avenae TaxID=200324 RepID=A0A2N5W6I6_9BASI|nr:hypothetical protein PCANC_01046 [Puccinia coronata f. sp. avenae]
MRTYFLAIFLWGYLFTGLTSATTYCFFCHKQLGKRKLDAEDVECGKPIICDKGVIHRPCGKPADRYMRYCQGCNRASDWPLLQVSNPSPSTPPTGLAPFRTTMILTAGLGQLRPYDDNHRYFLANSGRTALPETACTTAVSLSILCSLSPAHVDALSLTNIFIADLLPVTLGPKYLLHAQLQPAISMTGSRSS